MQRIFSGMCSLHIVLMWCEQILILTLDLNIKFSVLVRVGTPLRLFRVSGYTSETVITRFHFSVPITRKRLFKFCTKHLSYTNRILKFTKCVWGMGDVTSRF